MGWYSQPMSALQALLFSVLVLTLGGGCALPDASSLRPRGVDVWASGGRTGYQDPSAPNVSEGRWDAGVNVHFDITYGDEWESSDE